MENLIISVLKVLDDRRQDGFDIIAGKAGDSAEASEEKAKMIMNRVFELLAASWRPRFASCILGSCLIEALASCSRLVQRRLWEDVANAGSFPGSQRRGKELQLHGLVAGYG